MVTTVGLNSDFNVVVKSLITLEYDAMAAYETAIERFENPLYKEKLTEFLADHARHVQQLNAYAASAGIAVDNSTDAKAILTTGKVKMGALIGDRAILMAMKTNEDDTVTAYERATKHDNVPAAVKKVVEQAWGDEGRHRSWIVDTIAQMPGQKEQAA